MDTAEGIAALFAERFADLRQMVPAVPQRMILNHELRGYRRAEAQRERRRGIQLRICEASHGGGEKGTVYRAMVGPFETGEEASQFCKSLVSAGGQCFIPRN